AGLLVAAAALASCGDDGDSLFRPPPPPVPLAQVSDRTGFAGSCDQQQSAGTLYPSSEVEPFLAVNPVNPGNFIGVWQQDRWSNGGARGLVAGVSFDGGETWATRTAPFSRCTGGTLLGGGDYARATDPWVTFGPGGAAYWMAMTITDTPAQDITGMLVSRSTDGGLTWETPIVLQADDDPRLLNDKNSMTADPNDADVVYAVWDRLRTANGEIASSGQGRENVFGLGFKGPILFTRTTDGGDTWEAAREIYDPGPGAQTIGNLVAVLADGTLLNLFTEIHFDSDQPDGATLRVIRSTDQGATWSAPVTVAPMLSVGTQDPATGAPVRGGSILGSIATGPGGGDVWVAWQDSRYFFEVCANPPCVGPGDSIVLARSTDGGLSWGAPVLVPPDAQVQAFTPFVHVAADGTVGVTYYDLRDDTTDPDYLLTSYWLATSADGVAWTERRVSGPFDLAIAPDAFGLFLGDYQGLASAGTDFVPFFAQTFPSLRNRTNVYAVSLPTQATATAKAGASYQAWSGPVPAISGAWADRIRANVERSRHHVKERYRPRLPANYLR
ncbi:MAG: sialidase family protein, partial [Nevskiaceae bacterium]